MCLSDCGEGYSLPMWSGPGMFVGGGDNAGIYIVIVYARKFILS